MKPLNRLKQKAFNEAVDSGRARGCPGFEELVKHILHMREEVDEVLRAFCSLEGRAKPQMVLEEFADVFIITASALGSYQAALGFTVDIDAVVEQKIKKNRKRAQKEYCNG